MDISMQLSWMACLSVVLLSGCESTQSRGILSEPAITPSPYTRIGSITQVDLGSATVVVRQDTQNIQLNNELFVRSSSLEIVAVLRPIGIRTHKSVGMIILSGEPAIGLEVVQKIQP